jgi:hypothetical protein
MGEKARLFIVENLFNFPNAAARRETSVLLASRFVETLNAVVNISVNIIEIVICVMAL